MLGDAELTQFRLEYYGLLARLFAQAPDEELLATLAEDCDERAQAAERVHPGLGEGWRTIGEALSGDSRQNIPEEFDKAIQDPFGETIDAYESHYLSERLYGAPLVAVREFMNQVGLEKSEQEFSDPEDALVFELEIMRWLITKQQSILGQEGEQRWVDSQCEFLSRHLLIWGDACARDLEAANDIPFYRGAAQLLRGFLDVERQLLHDQGITEIETLEAARERYSGTYWKGPTFDPETMPTPPASDSTDD